MGCIFEEQVRSATSCLFVGLFNIRCARSSYYGKNGQTDIRNGYIYYLMRYYLIFRYPSICGM